MCDVSAAPSGCGCRLWAVKTVEKGGAQVAEGGGGRVWYEFWPLMALCLLGGSRWLVEGALPETASTRMSQAIGCAMAAGLMGALAAMTPGRSSTTDNSKLSRGGFLGAALVLVGPAFSQVIGGRYASADSATLALALVSVVLAVAGSASGGAESGDLPGLLWPGLTGLTGLLLLLPEPSFSSWRPWTGLIALPILVGAGAWLFEGSQSPERGPKGSPGSVQTFLGLVFAGVIFGGFAFESWRGGAAGNVSWNAAGLDGLSALLTLETLRRLGAMRWASQFLLVPLLGLAEGLVFLRPILDFRSWVGLVLLAIGGIFQMIRSGSEGSVVTTLGASSVSGR